ncbi:hypothetical protein FHG87_005985 [Trinorchestia longiramus]|nr:hypothetical protein FHG87_005985 [Trinorchestia longiramus]
MKQSKSNERSHDSDLPDSKHCLQITFPKKFSIKQELSFFDYIADAKNIFFNKDVYAVCQDVETAVALAQKSYLNKVPHGLIKSITRLGPASCAFKSRTDEPTVLTIRKLALGTTHQCLAVRFPDALDICLKRTMAKLLFASGADCRKAYRQFPEVVWPGDQMPSVKKPSSDGSPEQRQTPHSHHDQFAEDPKVVHVRLNQNFSVKKHIALLDHLNAAADIFLAEQCKVIFEDSKEILKRQEVLRSISVMGGSLTLTPYFDTRNKGGNKRPLVEHERPASATQPQTSKKTQEQKDEPVVGKKKRRLQNVSGS